jgi:hypothetical protein
MQKSKSLVASGALAFSILGTFVVAAHGAVPSRVWLSTQIPDGRTIAPVGFVIPFDGFPGGVAMSPDTQYVAIASLGDGNSLEVLAAQYASDTVVQHVDLPALWGGLVWTSDGAFASSAYSGAIYRFTYAGAGKQDFSGPPLVRGADIQLDPGLIGGLTYDQTAHRLYAARPVAGEVDAVDVTSGTVVSRTHVFGQPYGVALAGGAVFASMYNIDEVDAWRGNDVPVRIVTGNRPSQLLSDGNRVFAANAGGHDVVEIDAQTLKITRRFDLALRPNEPPGQTPSGMAISADRTRLFVAESGYNGVAIVNLMTGKVVGRIPTAWYPTAVVYGPAPKSEEGERVTDSLWIANGKGFGSQPNTLGEWDGTYTGLIQHVSLRSAPLADWTKRVARSNSPSGISHLSLPHVKHVVFIVKENKHFDEEFADIPGTAADPSLLLYGRHYTPNAHALAERFTVFDNFMTNGEASIWGHSWTTTAEANDYHERNGRAGYDPKAPAMIAESIWPVLAGNIAGEANLKASAFDFDHYKNLSDLGIGPRANPSGIFGPRGELFDECLRKGVSFRVYGEQLTVLPNGNIAPGLAAHADPEYPGTHINFDVLDTQRAALFIKDMKQHGLAQYTYMTLPTDHTVGVQAGYLYPQSYIADNDHALGEIVEAISHSPYWKDTVIFVTFDDAQGTGDHLDSHRMPAFAIGPMVRRGFVDHTRYSQVSVLKTAEVLLGLDPLTIYDERATPMVNALAIQPDTRPYTAVTPSVPIQRPPGLPKQTSFDIDSFPPGVIPRQEWIAVKGLISWEAHVAYLRKSAGWLDMAENESTSGGI